MCCSPCAPSQTALALYACLLFSTLVVDSHLPPTSHCCGSMALYACPTSADSSLLDLFLLCCVLACLYFFFFPSPAPPPATSMPACSVPHSFNLPPFHLFCHAFLFLLGGTGGGGRRTGQEGDRQIRTGRWTGTAWGLVHMLSRMPRTLLYLCPFILYGCTHYYYSCPSLPLYHYRVWFTARIFWNTFMVNFPAAGTIPVLSCGSYAVRLHASSWCNALAVRWFILLRGTITYRRTVDGRTLFEWTLVQAKGALIPPAPAARWFLPPATRMPFLPLPPTTACGQDGRRRKGWRAQADAAYHAEPAARQHAARCVLALPTSI